MIPRKLPDNLSFVDGASTLVRSLKTVRIAMTASGARVQRSEPAVRMTRTAPASRAKIYVDATARLDSRPGCSPALSVASVVTLHAVSAEIAEMRSRGHTSDTPRKVASSG
jgi:hypothetical protein